MKYLKTGLISFCITASLLGGFFYTTGFTFPDPDGFYHAKMSELLYKKEIGNKFQWLPLTSWGDSFANQHFFYHQLLKPFGSISLLPLSVIIFVSLTSAGFVILLERWRVKYVWFWLFIFLFSSADFLFRMSLVKANNLSLLLLLVFIGLMVKLSENRYELKQYSYLSFLVILSASFVFLYGGFVFLPVLGGLYFVIHYILKKQILWFIPVGIMLGFGSALLLHPQHLNIISHLYDQIFNTGLGAGSRVPAGVEWLPYNLEWFLKTNYSLLLIFVVSILIFFSDLKNKLRSIRESNIEIWLLVFTVFLFIITLMYRRFIEYLAPFALISSIAILKPYLFKITKDKIFMTMKNWQGIVAMLVIVFIFVSAGVLNVRETYKSYIDQPTGYEYQTASMWMNSNSRYGEIIFNTQWDEFPQLFYWNSDNYYITGMDPTFFYIANPELYWQWRKVADDDRVDKLSVEEIHEIVKKDFNSKFLFIDKSRNPNLWNKIVAEDIEQKYFAIGYEDALAVVFEVN